MIMKEDWKEKVRRFRAEQAGMEKPRMRMKESGMRMKGPGMRKK